MRSERSSAPIAYFSREVCDGAADRVRNHARLIAFLGEKLLVNLWGISRECNYFPDNGNSSNDDLSVYFGIIRALHLSEW